MVCLACGHKISKKYGFSSTKSHFKECSYMAKDAEKTSIDASIARLDETRR